MTGDIGGRPAPLSRPAPRLDTRPVEADRRTRSITGADASGQHFD
jgi:hypothetical protein